VKVEKDYEEFVRLLNAQNVEYLLVGAYAGGTNMPNRAIPVILISLINPTKKNAKRVLAVLKNLVSEAHRFLKANSLDPEMVIQLGFPPRARIDLITSLGTADNLTICTRRNRPVRLGRVNYSCYLIRSSDRFEERGRPPERYGGFGRPSEIAGQTEMKM